MANPNFNITSDNVLYTNALTPFSADPLSSDIYSKSYYLWDFGDGNTSPLSSASHVYTEAGIYDVTMSQYLSSGDIVSSESQTITAHNLIPNLMKWAGDSYASSSIVASVKNSIPFKAEVYNSYQTYDENSFLTFYVENSNSIPFDITDKRIHLKPTWRFVDVNENVIDTVSLTHTKLYAQMVNDEIIIGEGLNPSESVFVGTSSTAEFYFIDDTPSGIDVDESSYLPSTIIVSQPLTSKYGDVKFGNENYIQYPNLINSVFVDNVTPYRLDITSNGIFDFDPLKFQNTAIPFNIRLVDVSGNYIKTNPFESELVGSYNLDIGFIGDVDILPSPSLSGNSLLRFKTDFSKLGGFYESYFTPTNISTASVILTASTLIDYTLNRNPTRFGAFSDENSNRIYRVSFIEGFSTSYNRKDSEIIGNTFDGFTSNKFGTAITPSYETIFLDSDDSRIETYDTAFNVLTSIELSSYDESINGHVSPAQLCFDESGNYFITLTDASKLIYSEDNILTEMVLYPPIPSNVIVDEFGNYVVDGGLPNYVVDNISLDRGELLFQPTAIELISDNTNMYISYVSNLSANFIGEYSIDRTNGISVLSSDIIELENYQAVDMVSNRDGDILYVLAVNVNTQESYIRSYDTSTNALLSSESAGFNSEFITIDINQSLWVASKSISSSNVYDTLYTIGNTYPLSQFGGINSIKNIGGIAGDSYGNVWLIDSDNDRVVIFNASDPSIYQNISITEDLPITTNKYVAYGDWNGFRWYNKFGYGGTVNTYSLSGESEPFVIHPKNKYNLQKINEDFDMTETLKSYRTTESMLDFDHLFDDFLGSIFGNKYDDGTYFGKNMYEKIANFVMNHSDVDTCSIDALKSVCSEVGIDFEVDLVYPRDIKRIVDLFSIKYKKLWGDQYTTGVIEDFKGASIDISTYTVLADPQTKIIATERFNEYNTIITPLIFNDLTTYPLSSYSQDWGWGLSVPSGGNLVDYYDFFEMLPVESTKMGSVIDWDNELTDTSIQGLSSYDNFMVEGGIISTVLGDKIRQGLGIFL